MDQEERQEMFENSQIAGAMGQTNQSNATAEVYMEEQNRNLAETQLEVDSIRKECYHLLRQDVLEADSKGIIDWHPIKNKVARVLTDDGVAKLMTPIHFYINKNTLLSNFDEDQINRMMLRFCVEVNDLFLLKYEVLFSQATVDECITILKERNSEQAKIRAYAYLLSTGKKKDEKEIEKEIVKETEKTIEKEINKIRAEQRREKIREYGIIMAQIEHIVFAALNRAWKGEERGSIRRHTNISEIIGGRPMPQKEQQGGVFSRWRS